jgi:predicted dehydrogenase
MDTVRLGVVGAGFIGKIHMGQFGKLDDVVLAGVYDPLEGAAAAAAKQFGVEKVYGSDTDLIEDASIDTVVLGVPNKLHAKLAVKALEAGKNVLLEKPMALSGAQSAEIVKARRKSGKVLMIAHQMRWQDLSQQIKTQAEAGEFGKIYNAKTAMWRTCNIPGWGSWFTRKDESGGGPLIDIGVHALDLAMYLMGDPKPISVFGSTYAEFGPKRKGLGSWGTPDWTGYFDVEDLATAMIKMEDGSTLTLEVSWAANTDPSYGQLLHLMGTEGGASLYSNHGLLINQKFGRTCTTELKARPNAADPRALLSRHFIDCVKSGTQPISDGVSGLKNNMILDAIYESAKSGEMVKLDWSILE